jgi:hypothetical protein
VEKIDMSKDDQPKTTDQPKPISPPPVPPPSPPEPITRKKTPPIPKIPKPENAYKNWGNKKEDN